MIALSSLAEAPTSRSILNCTMFAQKPAYPIATQRYPKTYTTKNNGLFCQYAVIIKLKPKHIQSKKAQNDTSNNDLITSCPHISYQT